MHHPPTDQNNLHRSKVIVINRFDVEKRKNVQFRAIWGSRDKQGALKWKVTQHIIFLNILDPVLTNTFVYQKQKKLCLLRDEKQYF